MDTKIKSSKILAVLSACATLGTSHASLLVYEDFEGTNYVSGANIVGVAAQGFGLTGNWLAAGASPSNPTTAWTTQSASPLSYAAGDISISGGSQYAVANGSGLFNTTAAWNVQLADGLVPTVGSTYYMSFLFRLTGTAAITGQQYSLHLSSANETADVARAGVRNNPLEFGLNTSASGSPVVGDTYFGVLKLLTDSGANGWDSASFYVNPTSTTVEGTPTVSFDLGAAFSTINYLGIRVQNASSLASFSVDEIRIGTSWTSVVTQVGIITFTPTGVVTQSESAATPEGDYSTITGNFEVITDGAGALVMTNAGNDYTGTTSVIAGTLRADVDAPSGAAGAFGNAVSAITVGDISGSDDATLDIGADGVTIGRAVEVVSGSSGTKTLGTSLTNGTAMYSGAVVLGTALQLTSDGTANAVFSGQISGTGGITKVGSGTVTLSGSGANSFGGATTVSAGTLLLNKTGGEALASTVSISVTNEAVLLVSQSGQVNDTATVSLSGGTIRRGSGVSEVFGSLSITGSGILDFGTGTAGNLTFGIYEENTTPSALLTLQNFIPGNSFTFSNALFAADGSNIGSYFSFGTGYINSSIIDNGSGLFTITAIPEPSTYLAAAGLLSLMLWPSRKRLLKDAKKILGLRAPMSVCAILAAAARSRFEPMRRVSRSTPGPFLKANHG